MIISRTLAYFLGAAAIMSILFGAGYYQGNNHATEKYLPQLTELQTRVKVAGEQAKETAVKQKENSDAIKSKDDKYRAAIAYYERMLSKAAAGSGSSGPSQNTTGVDAGPGQPTITGCPAEVESRLLEDARVRAGMAEFFRSNGFPVGE